MSGWILWANHWGEIQGMEWRTKASTASHSNGETHMGKHETQNYEQNMLVSGNCCSLNIFLLMSLSFLKENSRGWGLVPTTSYFKISKTNSHVNLKWFENASLPAMFWDVSTIHTSTFGKATSPTVEPHESSTKMPHLSSQPFFVRNQPLPSIRKPDFECWNLQSLENWNPKRIYKTWPNWIPYYIWCINPWRAGTVDWEFPLASFPPLRCQRCVLEVVGFHPFQGMFHKSDIICCFFRG